MLCNLSFSLVSVQWFHLPKRIHQSFAAKRKEKKQEIRSVRQSQLPASGTALKAKFFLTRWARTWFANMRRVSSLGFKQGCRISVSISFPRLHWSSTCWKQGLILRSTVTVMWLLLEQKQWGGGGGGVGTRWSSSYCFSSSLWVP